MNQYVRGGRLYNRTIFKTKEFKAENPQPTATVYLIISSSGEQNWNGYNWNAGSKIASVAVSYFVIQSDLRWAVYFLVEARSVIRTATN